MAFCLTNWGQVLDSVLCSLVLQWRQCLLASVQLCCSGFSISLRNYGNKCLDSDTVMRRVRTSNI
nr:unnamed protein product [Callosobruchus chinensis]